MSVKPRAEFNPARRAEVRRVAAVRGISRSLTLDDAVKHAQTPGSGWPRSFPWVNSAMCQPHDRIRVFVIVLALRPTRRPQMGIASNVSI